LAGKRLIYKIADKKPELALAPEQSMNTEIKTQFIGIKVKKQNYLGRPSISMFIRDVTKRLNGKLE